ncbi:hypothetical protein ACQRXC_10820 [Niallia taxi]|uniref:hypothetical protein n=1 Tax=Niallia taxi TaxID=2499688 RepID=UPI003F60690C
MAIIQILVFLLVFLVINLLSKHLWKKNSLNTSYIFMFIIGAIILFFSDKPTNSHEFLRANFLGLLLVVTSLFSLLRIRIKESKE